MIQLINILDAPAPDFSALRFKEENQSVTLWLLQIFADVCMVFNKQKRINVTSLPMFFLLDIIYVLLQVNQPLGGLLLNRQVLNLMFEVVAISEGETRVAFTRLLSKAVRLNLDFDSEVNFTCINVFI